MASVQYWNKCEICEHEETTRLPKEVCSKCKSSNMYSLMEHDEPTNEVKGFDDQRWRE